jgi:hypothetical protein
VSSESSLPTDPPGLAQRSTLAREAEEIRGLVPRLLPSVARLEAVPEAAERRLATFAGGRVGCVVVVLRDLPASAQERFAQELSGICRRSDLLFALGFDTLVLVAPGATEKETTGFHTRLAKVLEGRPGLRLGRASRAAEATEPFDLRTVAHAAYRDAVTPRPQ